MLSDAADEAIIIAEDWIFVNSALATMQSQNWATQLEEVAAMRKDLNARIAKYFPRFKNPPQIISPDIFTKLEMALARCIEAETVWKELAAKKGEVWLYSFGEQDLTFSATDQSWVADFRQIQNYLENKPLFLKYLLPLAQTLTETTSEGDISHLVALKAGLAELETEVGFSGVAEIPLKILPLEDFLNLMREGYVVDDFGVGLQHGELTHRLHWYSIIKAYQSGQLNLNHPPIEVYKAINLPRFAQGRDGSSIWAELFDQSVSASADNYCDGGTLNRDLLEADPHWDKINIGLAEREEDYQRPNTVGLEPISQALSELRRSRIGLVERVATPAEKSNSLWVNYGFPTPSAVRAFQNL